MDDQPPAAVQIAEQEYRFNLAVFSEHRQAGQLREKGDARLHGQKKCAKSGCIISACRPKKSTNTRKLGANTTTCYMPFINAFFRPRKNSDRPKVVPEGAVNFAFIGQFAETPRDTIFTIEYSMRTGMESVYTLLDIDRAVPEVWGACTTCASCCGRCITRWISSRFQSMKLSMKEKSVERSYF